MTAFGQFNWKGTNHQWRLWCTDKKSLQNETKIRFMETEKYLWTDIATAIYIYTQEPGMSKAIITIVGTFFMIGQVVLSIDDQYISPCNSLPLHCVSTKKYEWVEHPFLYTVIQYCAATSSKMLTCTCMYSCNCEYSHMWVYIATTHSWMQIRVFLHADKLCIWSSPPYKTHHLWSCVW